jgi:hypothetical protein
MAVVVVVEAHRLIMERVQQVAAFVAVDKVYHVIMAGMEFIKSQNRIIYTENQCRLRHQKLMTRMMTITVEEMVTEITELWRNIIRRTSSRPLG